jgi:small-conductance mechanosensitive channel
MDRDRLITIGCVVVFVILLSWLSERWFRSQERRLAERYRGDFASAKTRFRLARRVVVAVVIIVGSLSALTTIPATQDLARALLASGAVAAVVAGFALRTPLGNVAAGLQIAFTQPFRLGDRITVDPCSGVVEEIKLSYTVLRTDDGRRAYLPNEQLIATPIVNATIEDPTRAQTITVPVAPGADLERARAVLQEVADGVPGRIAAPAPTVFVTDVTNLFVTVSITAWVADGGVALQLSSDMRERAVSALRAEGMLAASA